MLLITGGAGFIGGNFVHYWCQYFSEPIIVLDKLTYAGNPLTIEPCCKSSQVELIHGDIGDQRLVHQLLKKYAPRAVIHFAAETHVDRSVLDPSIFVKTNVVGSANLLETTLKYWQTLSCEDQENFRFLHISTDEVFGMLDEQGLPFTEASQYAPNNPYSASKAASDHFVRAYHRTYGFPTIITHCSNNYGPYQFPEKLVPLVVLNALEGNALPIYGDGKQIRDWLFVTDHCAAIANVLSQGVVGDTYNIGGCNEMTNLDLVTFICQTLDIIKPKTIGSYGDQIKFIQDRPGHDLRYAINSSKIQQQLGWRPVETIESGIVKTIHWYINQLEWVCQIKDGSYRDWVDKNYHHRLVLL